MCCLKRNHIFSIKVRLPLFEVLLSEIRLFWLAVSSFSWNTSCLPAKSWRHTSPFCTLKETPFFSLERWPVETKEVHPLSERFRIKSPMLFQSLEGVHALSFYTCNNLKMWLFLYIFCICVFSCVKSVRDLRDVNVFMHDRILYFKQWRTQFSECRLWLATNITR